MSTDSRKQVRNYVACEFHGNRRAEVVCGECGTPLCDDCTARVSDITLDHYETGGASRVLFALVFAVGIPLLLTVVFPRLILSVSVLFVDHPLFIKNSLVTSSIIVGIALLGALRFRTDADFELLTRRTNERVVCADCKPGKNRQRYVRYAVVGVAGLLVVFGLARSVPGLVFTEFWISGVGVAFYIVRDEVVSLVARAT